jgi:hypothetical protein
LPLGDLAEELQQFQQLETAPAHGLTLFIIQLVKWGFLALILGGTLAVLAFSISHAWKGRRAPRSVEHESVWEAGTAAKDARDALESRWRRWREEVRAHLARLRGEESSLVTIQQIYASLVRMATASGFPRREAETPYEFIAGLHRAFPGSENEIRLITNAYVRAHYGERTFPPEHVRRVRDAWLAIRTRREDSDRS